MFGQIANRLRNGIDFLLAGVWASRRNVVNYIAGTGMNIAVVDNQAQDRVDVTITSIDIDLVQNNGVSLPQRTILNFAGAASMAQDDPVNTRTTVIAVNPADFAGGL